MCRSALAAVLGAVANAVAGAAVAAAPGDPKAGEVIYARCLACHALAYDRVGPRHCGIFGRHAGSVPGFQYSPAMKKAKMVWNEKTLDRFIANPLKAVPGTNMTYAGVTNPGERADLIAYLKHANASAECKKQAQYMSNRNTLLDTKEITWHA